MAVEPEPGVLSFVLTLLLRHTLLWSQQKRDVTSYLSAAGIL